ncbi:MAG: GFA family protein [Erythrobacter sp.]
MRASCLCGEVTITLPSRPTAVTFCDCSPCRKSGAAWSYFPRGAVSVSGATRAYLRRDVPDPVVEVHHCPKCGAATHWIATAASGIDRMGANMRLFPPSEVAGMQARFMDGVAWDGESEPSLRRPDGTLGEDAFV